jgi:hypothetical protein
VKRAFYKYVVINKEEIMKCLACGREMLSKGMAFFCPNILCDYEEEIENNELKVLALLLKNEIPAVVRAIK